MPIKMLCSIRHKSRQMIQRYWVLLELQHEVSLPPFTKNVFPADKRNYTIDCFQRSRKDSIWQLMCLLEATLRTDMYKEMIFCMIRKKETTCIARIHPRSQHFLRRGFGSLPRLDRVRLGSMSHVFAIIHAHQCNCSESIFLGPWKTTNINSHS